MSILVIDIGGSYIKYAYMTPEAEILDRGVKETPKDIDFAPSSSDFTSGSGSAGAPGSVQAGRSALLGILSSLYRERSDIEGIAISLPGIIDAENGYIVMGGALRYNDDFYLRHELYALCPVPITMENDANCAGLAEAARGSLKDVNDGFFITIGTMIGGAYIKDKKLHHGHHFAAGEISYINTLRDAPPTAESVWGNRCSALGLCYRYALRKGLAPESVSGIDVFNAVEAGDADAVSCLGTFARELAMQIFNLQTILDPERFAIGGGISARPELIEAIRKELDILYDSCPYRIPRAEVVTSKFQNDANLVGALQVFLGKYSDTL